MKNQLWALFLFFTLSGCSCAPEEIAQESKRKEELDIQYNDLTEALDKLSGAIKTIDTETKTRFQDSFDAINARMKEVFAKLFGGGGGGHTKKNFFFWSNKTATSHQPQHTMA